MIVTVFLLLIFGQRGLEKEKKKVQFFFFYLQHSLVTFHFGKLCYKLIADVDYFLVSIPPKKKVLEIVVKHLYCQ